MCKGIMLAAVLWMLSHSFAKPVRELHLIPRLSAPSKALRRVGDLRPAAVFNERQSAPLIQAPPPEFAWRTRPPTARLHQPQPTRDCVAAGTPAGEPVLTRDTIHIPLKIVPPPSVSQVGLRPGSEP